MNIRYSHPPEEGTDGVELSQHLEDVANRVRFVVSSDAETPAGESLVDVIETLAYVHDLGKATTYFQQHIGVREGSPERESLRYHAPMGAFAGYYALDAQGFETETCLAGFVAVAKHHGQIPDIAEFIHEWTFRQEGGSQKNQRRLSAIAKQIHDIDERAQYIGQRTLEAATDGAGNWSAFRNDFIGLLGEIEDTVSSVGNAPGFSRASLPETCYGLVVECWGSLVLADKTSAAEAAHGTTARESTFLADSPSLLRLNEYIGEIEESSPSDPRGSRVERLNHSRSDARTTIQENAEEFAENGGGVATITLPTGMGKTLSGITAAFTIRDVLEEERVVYALPFTSVIDQVIDELETVFEADTEGRILTAHHHLSETKISASGDQEEEDLADDVAGMLGESWRAGLTVTTFVQLFESLAGPRNTQSMKLPAIRNSVIVLDEPQSLPIDWWKLVPRLVNILSERFDATVIAMTATQPQLFEDATELVSNPASNFDAATRVEYVLDSSAESYIERREGPKCYDEAAADIQDAIRSKESTLAICNTIDSARALTDQVLDLNEPMTNIPRMYASMLGSDGDHPIPVRISKKVIDNGKPAFIHLSTRLRPIDRLHLIEIAKSLTEKGHTVVMVSTQLVEAGVDISFERVYRDLAPIDSIVQAAGRCNRSFERELGRVSVWWLEAPGDRERTPSEAVYNRKTSLLPIAMETLDSVRDEDGLLSETEVARTAVERYYHRLHDERNVGQQEYVEYVDEARGERLGELSLIENRLAVEVVVCRTADDGELVKTAEQAWESRLFDDLDASMHELRSKQISVPIYHEDSEEADAVKSLPRIHEDADVRYIDPQASQYEAYFDKVTGFVVPDSTVERRFL